MGGDEINNERIIILFDGTWNRPETGLEHASRFPSNIYKIWTLLGGPNLDRDAPQIHAAFENHFGKIFYIRGVGTEGGSFLQKLHGFGGTGLNRRLALAYQWFCSVYKPDLPVLVFGFSRGAFAARSFCSMLDAVGVVPECSEETAVASLNSYLDGASNSSGVQVSYLGIFDTVGTLHDSEERENDHRLSPLNVAHVRHALALDEFRESFTPIFWSPFMSAQTVEEAWFVGAHSNIGGGYENANLSNIALFWVLKGTESSGLMLRYETLSGYDTEVAGDSVRNSYRDFLQTFDFAGAIGETLGIRRVSRSLAANHRIHESVSEAFRDRNYFCQALVGANATVTVDHADALLCPWEFP